VQYCRDARVELKRRMKLNVEVIVLGEEISESRNLRQVDLPVLLHRHLEGQGLSSIACPKVTAFGPLHD